MHKNPFDFSNLKKGSILCRVHASVVNTATVTSISTDVIECAVDPIGQMRFDRRSGVHIASYMYGFLANCKKPTKNGLNELKTMLLEALNDPNMDLNRRRAIEYALRDPLWTHLG
jgi:hypothetical protein